MERGRDLIGRQATPVFKPGFAEVVRVASRCEATSAARIAPGIFLVAAQVAARTTGTDIRAGGLLAHALGLHRFGSIACSGSSTGAARVAAMRFAVRWVPLAGVCLWTAAAVGIAHVAARVRAAGSARLDCRSPCRRHGSSRFPCRGGAGAVVPCLSLTSPSSAVRVLCKSGRLCAGRRGSYGIRLLVSRTVAGQVLIGAAAIGSFALVHRGRSGWRERARQEQQGRGEQDRCGTHGESPTVREGKAYGAIRRAMHRGSITSDVSVNRRQRRDTLVRVFAYCCQRPLALPSVAAPTCCRKMPQSSAVSSRSLPAWRGS